MIFFFPLNSKLWELPHLEWSNIHLGRMIFHLPNISPPFTIYKMRIPLHEIKFKTPHGFFTHCQWPTSTSRKSFGSLATDTKLLCRSMGRGSRIPGLYSSKRMRCHLAGLTSSFRPRFEHVRHPCAWHDRSRSMHVSGVDTTWFVPHQSHIVGFGEDLSLF